MFASLQGNRKALRRRSRDGDGAPDRVWVSDLLGSVRLVRVRLVRAGS